MYAPPLILARRLVLRLRMAWLRAREVRWIGIAGANGKTTTTSMVAAVLGAELAIVALIQGWLTYADQHERQHGCRIGADAAPDRGLRNVLNRIGHPGEIQQRPRRLDQIGMQVRRAAPLRAHAVLLTRRARPDEIELRQIERRVQRIALDERERVTGHRPAIDAHHIEPSAMEAHGGPAGAAE